jgi:hypothetical protein
MTRELVHCNDRTEVKLMKASERMTKRRMFTTNPLENGHFVRQKDSEREAEKTVCEDETMS